MSANQFSPMAASSEEQVSLRTWIAVLGTVLGAFMAVLDIQITNASLREITGGIGSTAVEASWVSYESFGTCGRQQMTLQFLGSPM